MTVIARAPDPAEVLFAMRPVWRSSVRIDVSGPAKTIVDMLDDPGLGGGVRLVAHMAVQRTTSRGRGAACPLILLSCFLAFSYASDRTRQAEPRRRASVSRKRVAPDRGSSAERAGRKGQDLIEPCVGTIRERRLPSRLRRVDWSQVFAERIGEAWRAGEAVYGSESRRKSSAVMMRSS
jgi:hypothetical protein